MATLIRQDLDTEKWYLATVSNEIWDKVDKSQDGFKYFDCIAPKYRLPTEERVSEFFDTKGLAAKESCRRFFDNYKPNPASYEKHKQYAIKDGLDRPCNLYICNNCKIIMWHSMINCFGCPAKLKRSKITNRELIELYDRGYKIGW